jgi:predicted NUDIX family NTP pyrophosphohydrolase
MATSRDHSAGILLYRWGAHSLEVFLGHMGGPFWARKQEGSWSIPKGLVEGNEDLLATALREFHEEIGVPAPSIDYRLLGDFRYSSGKVVSVFYGESDLHVAEVISDPITVEWPRGTGRMHTFPEIDKVEWFTVDDARAKLVKGQVPALDALIGVS